MISDFNISSNEKSVIYSDANCYGRFAVKKFNFLNGSDDILIDYDKNSNSPMLLYGEDKIMTEFDEELYLFNMNNGEYDKIFSQDGYRCCFCDVSHDNSLVAFTSGHRKSLPNIFYANITTKETVKLIDSMNVNRFPYWSYSDKYIAYLNQKVNANNKSRYVGIYNVQAKEEMILEKSLEGQCYVNRQCWNKDKDEIIYVEITPEVSKVKVYSLEDKCYRDILEEKGIVEASFIDHDNILLIYNDISKIYSLSRKLKTNIDLDSDENILVKFHGAIVRIVNSNIYFLTTKRRIFKVNLIGEKKLILEGKNEETPLLSKSVHYLKSSDGVDIPVYENKPKKSNGLNCLLVIGGPNEKAADHDGVASNLLKKGYTVWVIAYRGCKEMPYKFGEMGKRDVLDVIEVGQALKNKLGTKIPVIGFSFGGFLNFLALSKCQDVFNCGVSLWGVTKAEYLTLHYRRFISKEMSEDEKQIAFNERDAVRVSKNIKTPMLIFHGEKDSTSTLEEVTEIKNNILRNNVDCELVIYENDGHGLFNNTDDYMEKMNIYLKSNA